jgi:hypothetical protein
VTNYRLYFLNHDDRIVDAADLDCNSDEQAIAEAQGYVIGYKIEVWQRDRKVGGFSD